jgi:hypothetical protein
MMSQIKRTSKTLKEHGSHYLVELAYNESWHSSIKMNLYEHFPFKKWVLKQKCNQKMTALNNC